MTPNRTLRRLLDELEQSLHQLELAYAHCPSAHLKGPLLRRRRAVSNLRRHAADARPPPPAPHRAAPLDLPGLIDREERLVESYAQALDDTPGTGPLRKMLNEQKSESEQALLAFALHLRRS